MSNTIEPVKSIRLIAIDIDGTLLDPHFQVTQRNRDALRAAHDAGLLVVLATGRRHDYALPIAQELGIPVSLISSNGAVIRSTSGQTFYTDFLPAETARKLIRHMDAFRGHAVITFDRSGHDALAVERVDELTKSVSRWVDVNAANMQHVVPLEAALTEDPIQAMYCGTLARMAEVQQRLDQAGFLDEISVVKTQYDYRDLCILDILHSGCSKGHALRRWTEHHGFRPEEIMAIGDNHNDLEMLEFAGLPVLMGNASEELKQNGWMVTASNEDSGVAQAVERLLGAGFHPSVQVK